MWGQDKKGDAGMDQSRIGTFITERRREKGLTQAQLAERLNITDRAVSKWETGKSLPDTSTMLELCGILGITADELLSGGRAAGRVERVVRAASAADGGGVLHLEAGRGEAIKNKGSPVQGDLLL